MTKAEIIRRGTELGVDYSLTHTCYAPNDGRHRLRPLRRLPTAPKRLRRGGVDRSDSIPELNSNDFCHRDTECTEKSDF